LDLLLPEHWHDGGSPRIATAVMPPGDNPDKQKLNQSADTQDARTET
jgi:hypothetical protein